MVSKPGLRHCVEELRLILGNIFFKKMAGGGHLDGFLVPKHHNKAFIVLLSDSRQSQLHYASKMNFLVACVAKMRLTFATRRWKNGFFTVKTKICP